MREEPSYIIKMQSWLPYCPLKKWFFMLKWFLVVTYRKLRGRASIRFHSKNAMYRIIKAQRYISSLLYSFHTIKVKDLVLRYICSGFLDFMIWNYVHASIVKWNYWYQRDFRGLWLTLHQCYVLVFHTCAQGCAEVRTPL